MKIGILQCGRAPDSLLEEFGDYDEQCKALLGAGFETRVYAVLDDEIPEKTDEADGWLITGSRHGAYENHSWIPPLEQFLRDVYSSAIPVVGICFGHQIFAQALGGKVEKFDAGWSVGLVEYKMNEANDSLSINAFHQDQVTTLPIDATVTGSTEFCRYAFLRYGNQAMTMQPHPEFSNEFTRALLQSRGKEILPDSILQEGLASFKQTAEQEKAAKTIREFFVSAQLENNGDHSQ